ncbi:MAG: hypothetical protein Kow00129_09770 [Thermoleophilia bacterium]
MQVSYLDIDDEKVSEYPELERAIADRRPLPLVLTGDGVKTPPVLSFGWVVNELRAQGALE